MGSLNVHVTYSSGQGRKGVRVSGSVAHGGMLQAVRTDSQGHAMLSWTSNSSYLDAIFIDGKKYKGKYQSGGSYAFLG